ncbi:MAG TPA: DUF1990 domain-containing protein [Microbacteriaceae bacterium]|nr:DUF1990 domain-containing protein [Microbacteriaceae bacterium]
MSARRSNFNARPVSYGAVGASLATDLLRFPPRGFWVGEHSARLGTGRERFEAARESMWQWAIHVNSGLEILDIVAGSEGGYRGLNQRAEREDLDPNEVLFTPQGYPYVNPGATISQRFTFWRWSFDLPARVVLLIDEENRAGYALGSLDGHPYVGEQAFVLDLRDDDSVWLTVRQLGQPANPQLRWFGPLFHWQQVQITKRYLRALHPTAPALVETAEPSDASGES